ncbi:MAG: phycobiliprotein lyase [Cyanobacteria bacterium M_surface_10_m2_179]|nr:phycobiliprotein lyase [Cyanobacteria bacterium M_surface_10_m2_179]
MTLAIDNALSFFQLSCGRWRSQRSVHHLLHRRAEAGGSLIVVEELSPSDQRLIELAQLHGQDPDGLVGGCWVRWSASMAWDKAGEDHTGESVIGLIPTDEHGREGILLRDLGYAEKAPASSRFCMDERDGLLLNTDYETMSVWERFAFAGPNIRVRSSTVEGLSNNASFCIETRCDDSSETRPGASTDAQANAMATPALSLLGW